MTEMSPSLYERLSQSQQFLADVNRRWQALDGLEGTDAAERPDRDFLETTDRSRR